MIYIVSILVAFFATFLITPFLKRFLFRAGVVGIDHHKKDKPVIATSGGLAVAFGVLGGLLSYIALMTFSNGISDSLLSFLAIVSSILIVTLVGLLDDLNVRSKKPMNIDKKDIRVGLPQWLKPLLTLPAAIPLIAVSLGDPTVSLPFVGFVNLGIIYPLILIPVGVVGASNAINLLGGFNGSETGMGIIYMFALGIFALITHNPISILFLITGASLIGFIYYNWYPARILPGDSLTYILGSVIATGVIVGNMEKLGFFMIILFIIEFFLKLGSKFKASSLGKLRVDGKLDPPYEKIYSITHLIMKFKSFKERDVTLILIFLQLLVAIFATCLVYFHYI